MTRDALVVGINQYPFLKDSPTSKAKHLKTPAGDAEAIAQLLETYGNFRVQRLPASVIEGKLQIAPNKTLGEKELEDAITHLFLPDSDRTSQTALLFFAGHGLRKCIGSLTQGSLATSDASPSKNLWGIRLQDLREILQQSLVKQQIIWLDCCFSGELLNFRETDLGGQSSRCDRFLIAASRDSEVAYQQLDGEHGVLTGALLKGLNPYQIPEYEWITDRILAVAVEQYLKAYYAKTKIPQTLLISNHGQPIELLQKRGIPQSEAKNNEAANNSIDWRVNLDSKNFNELVELLRPFMEDETSRRSCLVLALGNNIPVLQRITWGGSVATFIPHMVCRLIDYGEVAPSRQALWVLLEYVHSQAGVDVQQRINELRPLIDLRSPLALGFAQSHSDAATDTSSSVETPVIDLLVQKVRSRLHDDIQSLHGTMPLWGVDCWVPLGELFVDVNILEELSSSRRSELDDLWQDFTTGIQGYSSYRSLDRIGLGKEQKRVSGLEVLAKNTNLMVVGKPGSGKTTYLQRVVTECNAGNLQAHRIPVLIKLREFVEDGREVAYSLERYLERYWRLSDAETQLVLDRGRALVLLDGLDEVTGEDGKNITKEIKRFARTYPQVQVIVTCRTQSQESRFERFDYVEVADFNEPQVRAFAEHWFKTVMGDESAGLARAQEFLGLLFLEANKPIRELAITPILLGLTCAVFHQTGKFYSKRSKFYEEGLELLLEQWDKSREIERDEIYRDLSVERKLELLSYLAVKKFEQEQYVLFEQEEIEGYIAEFLGIGQRDSRVVLKAIESQHGLLIERSQRVWSFSHLTFQEYFTAKWFVDYADWQSLVSHIKEKHWREVFLLAVEMVKNTNQLLRLMKENVDTITAKDQNLQQFLGWLNQKHLSIKTFYKLAAVRAFYFVANSTLYVPYRNGLDFDLAFALDFKHGYARAVALSILPPDELTLSAIQVAKGIYALELDYDLALDRSLSNALSIASDFTIYNVKNATDPACPDSKLARELSIDLSRPGSLDPELDQILRNLKYQLPEPNKDERAKTWWRTNSRAWTEQLRSAMIKYRNIGQDWQFSDCQKQLLKQYYDANKLLVDCLNSGCVLSDRVREEIEETLLLPIAEIENRRGTRADL